MEPHTTFATLRDTLATLYAEEVDARIIVIDAGIDPSVIAFNDRAQINWHNILIAALHQNRLDALLQVMHTAYPSNPSFQAAYAQYIRFLDQGGKLTPPPPLTTANKQTPNIDTAGGTYIAGNVIADTGDIIVRDQHIAGDKVSGDKTTTINIGALKTPISLVLIISICLITVVGVITYPLVEQWLPAPLAFAPQATDETLIVVATFYNTAATNSEAHTTIRRAIAAEIINNNEQQVRVETEPTLLTADQRAEAEALGQRYNASMVIWGEDTGVEVIVNFLNLKEPNFDAAATTIRETERTQRANPSAYASFITSNLPQTMNFFVFFALGQSYYLNTQYTLAIERIETAITLLPPDAKPQGLAEAYFRLGWLYQFSIPNNLNQAIVDYAQAIQLSPEPDGAYNNRGMAHYDQGKLDDAIADYTKAIHLNPDSAFAYNNRGNALKAQGKLDDAIADYTHAILLNPDFATAYLNRGSALSDRGKLDDAIANYNKAMQLNPDHAAAYTGRGLVRSVQGKLNDAITDHTHAIYLDPNYADAYAARGLALSAQGKLNEAIADYTKAIHLNSDEDGTAYYNRGSALSALGKLDDAIADYTKAIQLNPDYAKAYNNRGSALSAQGKLDDAIADYTKAIHLNSDEDAKAYYNRGNALKAQGKLDDAIADYTKAIHLNPDDASAYNNRGNTLSDQGKLDDAIVDYTKTIALKSDHANAFWGRGLAYRNLGKWQEALADFQRYLELQPNAANRAQFEQWITEIEGKLSGQ